MTYKVVRFSYNEDNIKFDDTKYENKYFRRIGDNDWWVLTSDDDYSHLKPTFESDDIIKAEKAFNIGLKYKNVKTWDKVYHTIKQTYYSKREWNNMLSDEFQQSFFIEIKELLDNAYNLAIEDVDFEREYTDIVLANLQLIANKGIESITFKQWKSFKAYVAKYDIKDNVDIKTFYIKNDKI
jgi:hypothetical protein